MVLIMAQILMPELETPVAVPPQGKWVVQEAYNDGGFNSGYGNSVIARTQKQEKP
jgi:hypothetical protein